MPVFFIEPDAIRDNHIIIAGSLGHHLVDSLRVQKGEQLWFAEPGGPRYHAQVTRVERRQLTASIISQFHPPLPPGPHITLGIALIKNEHLEWAIQKATELGVARFMPLVTHRVVVRPRAQRAANRIARWQSIAREAAQQSMRWDIPEVTPPEPFENWCARQRQAECRLLLWENPQGSVLGETLRDRPKPKTVALAIGPEGGYDKDEVKLAQDQGFEVVSLGPRILRTESAAIAALTILQYEWGDVG